MLILKIYLLRLFSYSQNRQIHRLIRLHVSLPWLTEHLERLKQRLMKEKRLNKSMKTLYLKVRLLFLVLCNLLQGLEWLEFKLETFRQKQKLYWQSFSINIWRSMIIALDLQFLLLIFLSTLVTYNLSSVVDPTLRSQETMSQSQKKMKMMMLNFSLMVLQK